MELQQVKKVREEKDFTEVNKLLNNNWYLLKIVSTGKEFIYVMGLV